MNIVVKEVPKKELGFYFGKAYPSKGEVWVRKDLPKWIKMSVIVHELYHITDTAKDVRWREFKAVMCQLFMPLFGGVGCIFMTIFNRERIRYYIDVVFNRVR